MNVGGAAGPFSGSFQSHLTIRPPGGSFGGVTASGPSGGASLRDLSRKVMELRRTLDGLLPLARARTTGGTPRTPFALATSLSALNVSAPATAARVASTGEINTFSTAYSPTDPAFQSSNVDVTLGGTYDGSNGTDDLSFVIRTGGIVGLLFTRAEVRNGAGAVLQTLNIGSGYSPGNAIALSNGMTVAFGSGAVSAGDSFTVNVSTFNGSVNTSAAFDQTGAQGPNFDPDLNVTAGSFDVNGTTISVAGNDSVQSVLDRINASAAGVTALFDAADEVVRITHDTPGAAGDIVFANDTSGFLDAVKLSGATTVAGQDRDVERALDDVAPLSGIASGTFRINGVELTVDTATDSLLDVLESIRASIDGAAATYSGDKVTLRGPAKTSLVLEDGTSGLFTALGIVPGEYAVAEQRAAGQRTTFKGGKALPGAFDKLTEALRDVFELELGSGARGAGSVVRTRLQTVVQAAFGKPGKTELRSGFGIDFDFTAASGEVLKLNLGQLDRAVRRDAKELDTFLSATRKTNGRDGLLTGIASALRELEDYLANTVGPGQSFDVLA